METNPVLIVFELESGTLNDLWFSTQPAEYNRDRSSCQEHTHLIVSHKHFHTFRLLGRGERNYFFRSKCHLGGTC